MGDGVPPNTEEGAVGDVGGVGPGVSAEITLLRKCCNVLYAINTDRIDVHTDLAVQASYREEHKETGEGGRERERTK